MPYSVVHTGWAWRQVTPAKSWLIGKDPDAGRDWGQEEKGTEDEMAGWHHRLDGHEFKWTLGVGDGQGGLACCNSWGRKESDTTECLNWTELMDFRGDPVAKISPSNAGGASSRSLVGELWSYMPCGQNNQNIKKQKQYCNKLKKD